MIDDKLLQDLQKEFGADRVFRASEAPNVEVVSTGITSLDVATGVGGFVKGTLVEVFGRESTGKTALSVYAMAEHHRAGRPTALINLESSITEEGWLKWAKSIAPSYFDGDAVLIMNTAPGTDSLIAFNHVIQTGKFGLVVYDSIGAMSTDKELKIKESKQAYGQSAMVTQLVKQAAHYAYDTKTIALFINQVRDDAAGQYILEKAPGGHAKDHFCTTRVHLKASNKDAPKDKIDGEEIQVGFRVNARLVKNKVGSPRRVAGWNYWNFPSPSGVIGIDTFQDTVDVALRSGMFERRGAWYYNDLFPDGKLNGGVAVTNFLRENPDVMESVRRKLVIQAYNDNSMLDEEAREVLTDAV